MENSIYNRKYLQKWRQISRYEIWNLADADFPFEESVIDVNEFSERIGQRSQLTYALKCNG